MRNKDKIEALNLMGQIEPLLGMIDPLEEGSEVEVEAGGNSGDRIYPSLLHLQ